MASDKSVYLMSSRINVLFLVVWFLVFLVLSVLLMTLVKILDLAKTVIKVSDVWREK